MSIFLFSATISCIAFSVYLNFFLNSIQEPPTPMSWEGLIEQKEPVKKGAILTLGFTTPEIGLPEAKLNAWKAEKYEESFRSNNAQYLRVIFVCLCFYCVKPKCLPRGTSNSIFRILAPFFLPRYIFPAICENAQVQILIPIPRSSFQKHGGWKWE